MAHDTLPSATDRDAAERRWLSRPDARARRHARVLLLVTCVAIVVAHAVGADLSRAIHWDESVHLTQVLLDGRPAVFFEPHRTRGVAVLAAPIGLFDPSMFVFRSFLLVAGAIGTYLAFATWIPVVGVAAPLAAALYSANWFTVFYTVELLPNHPSALLAVGLAGLVARTVDGDEPRRLALTGALLFLLFGLVRPPDAVVAGLGVALVLVVVVPRVAARVVPAMAAGGALSFAVWFVEGWARFRFGPFETVRSAGEYAVGGRQFNQFGLYLTNLENRLRCVASCQEEYLAARAADGWVAMLPPPRTLTLLMVAATLTIVALVVAEGRRAVLAAALVPAASMMAFYSFSGGAVNMRYIMPVIALAVIVPLVGATVVWRWSRMWAPPLALVFRGVTIVLLAATLIWQAGHGLGRLDSPGASRVRAAAIGGHLAEVVGEDACTLLTPTSYPPLQYWSGCRATLLRVDGDRLQPPLGELHSYVDVAARAGAGDRILAVVRGEPPPDSVLATWERLPEEPWEGYAIYEWDGRTPIPEPPCPPADGPQGTLVRVLSEGC